MKTIEISQQNLHPLESSWKLFQNCVINHFWEKTEQRADRELERYFLQENNLQHELKFEYCKFLCRVVSCINFNNPFNHIIKRLLKEYIKNIELNEEINYFFRTIYEEEGFELFDEYIDHSRFGYHFDPFLE